MDKKSSSSTGRPRRGVRAATRPEGFRLEDGNLVKASLPGPRPVPIPARVQRDASVEREVFCPSYDACLDVASRNGWDDFTCRLCPLAKLAPHPSAVRYAHDRPGERE